MIRDFYNCITEIVNKCKETDTYNALLNLVAARAGLGEYYAVVHTMKAEDAIALRREGFEVDAIDGQIWIRWG